MIFTNPPLVELIAELRWVPGTAGLALPTAAQAGIAQVAAVQFPATSPFQEEGFSRFSNKVAATGFVVSERLMPLGFPLIPFTVVYRFRQPPAAQENYLYQIGSGVFSTNALPPYRSWDSFRPVVQKGVTALLESRHETENIPFTTVLLRYIDLFSEEFTEGKRSFRFLNDVLGIRVELPSTLKEQASDMNGVQTGIQLSMRLKNGLAMNVNLQDGSAAGKPGIVMSTEVLTVEPTLAEIAAIMQTFENAHTSIRVTFLGLTERLSVKMQPVQ
jgi:uncharacterized protein (TIGR04255 family)